VLLSTPLHASSNFTPFAECICTACKQKGIKKYFACFHTNMSHFAAPMIQISILFRHMLPQYLSPCCHNIFKIIYINSVALVRERTNRPSGRRFSVKLVPTFGDRGCHVVSVLIHTAVFLTYRPDIYIYIYKGCAEMIFIKEIT
jgi:hypothetical protein